MSDTAHADAQTSTTFRRNIRKLWRRADRAGRLVSGSWYLDAHEGVLAIAREYGQSIEAVAGVVAAISPGLRWASNLADARRLVAWHVVAPSGPVPTIPTYCYRNVEKAIRILQGEAPEAVLSGAKVVPFYRLIRDGGNALDLCVDTHAIDIAVGESDAGLREKAPWRTTRNRNLAERAYRDVALELGVLPCVLQAVTWVVWKESAKGRQDLVPF